MMIEENKTKWKRCYNEIKKTAKEDSELRPIGKRDLSWNRRDGVMIKTEKVTSPNPWRKKKCAASWQVRARRKDNLYTYLIYVRAINCCCQLIRSWVSSFSSQFLLFLKSSRNYALIFLLPISFDIVICLSMT